MIKRLIFSLVSGLLLFTMSGIFGFTTIVTHQIVVFAADMTQAVEAWLKSFQRKATPNNTPADAYEIKYTGPDNVLLRGGGSEVWADGVRASDGTVLEAKYVGKPNRSPYVPGSNCPLFIAEGITTQTDDEFKRYAAVINDPKTPVDKLEVVTNEKAAVPFFQCLMQKHSIPGNVVVKP
jgi:hypothetical protein